MHEAQSHEQSSFITATYDDYHLPFQGNTPTLRYTDLQKFIKRIRKAGHAIKYYAVGEYGEKTHRPHYHICMFGQAWIEGRQTIKKTPHHLWTSPELQELWGLGNILVGALTPETAQYTAAYCIKKLRGKQRYVRVDDETGELIEVQQPQALMSRRPPIGQAWIEKYGQQTWAHDHVIVNGSKQLPPKYYDKVLAKRSDIAHQILKAARLERATKNLSPATETALHARARDARARARQRQFGE